MKKNSVSLVTKTANKQCKLVYSWPWITIAGAKNHKTYDGCGSSYNLKGIWWIPPDETIKDDFLNVINLLLIAFSLADLSHMKSLYYNTTYFSWPRRLKNVKQNLLYCIVPAEL